MNYILYCSFRQQKYTSETIYSILSLLRISDIDKTGTKIIILTDNTDPFKKVFNANKNIIIEHISCDLLEDWLNGSNYVFRLKIKAIQYFFEKYYGNVLFFDSDTVVLNNIDILFSYISQNKFIMYESCPSIDEIIDESKSFDLESVSLGSQNRIKLYIDLIKSGSISGPSKSFSISPSFRPYNSGIIGMNYHYKYLINDVLELSDLLYNNYNFRSAEEFAFTYVFQNIGEIIKSNDLIFHYYYEKNCRYILAELLNFFHGDDNDKFIDILKEIDLDGLKEFNLQIQEIPYFIYFWQNYLTSVSTENKNKVISIYFDKDSVFFRAMKDLKMQKRFYRVLCTKKRID